MIVTLSSTYGNEKNVHNAYGYSIKALAITFASCPLLDDDDLIIVPSTCNGSDGQITGIRANDVTGIARFTWRDNGGKIVGTEANLIGVPAGVYTVELADDSKCKVVTSVPYTIGVKNQVSLNNSTTQIKQASCNAADGAVTNITITNAVSYKWLNSNNQTIAVTADLTKVTSGTYTLVATNKDGCSTQASYQVPGTGSAPGITRIDTNNINCGDISYFDVTFNSKPTDPVYRYFLYDAGGNQTDMGAIVYNPDTVTFVRLQIKPLMSGTLVVSDPTNCRTTIGTFTMPASTLVIDTSTVYVRNDACGKHTGAIVNLHLKNVPASKPLRQKVMWTDESGKVISQQLLNLTGVGAGTYTVSAIDPNGCSDSKTFTIKDSVNNIAAPQVADVKLCLPQTVNIPVSNSGSYTGFRLYDADSTLLKESKYPLFSEKVAKTTTYYITAINGLCESAKTRLTVSVALPGLNIPNTFTPNGDGINDYWQLTGVEQYPGTETSVFNRYGQLVYHSINYAQPFNGNFNGGRLPAGVYYYIIDPKKSECQGKISGSLTLVR